MTPSPLRTGLLLALTAGLPAQDDRDRDTPTSAIWLANQDTTQLTALSNDGWRFTDLEIETTAPWRFTVSAVANTGSYQKGWLYSIGVTAAQLSTTISQNNARIVDLEPYDDNGTTRFVAVLIGNAGADQKTWWWGYDMTQAQVDAAVTTNNARLTNFERYTKNGQTRFAVSMISNTGADQRTWGYLYGASAAAIALNIAVNQNRIYDLERVAADSYDVVLVQNAGFGHWYYHDQTAAAVTELLQQNVGRLVDIERHFTLSGARYNVVMIDNANALERKARQSFLAAGPTALGDYGFFLKEVNGPVLAQMRPDTTFEPASTMKTVYHVHAMRRVLLGTSSLTDPVNKPTSCGVPGSNQTLELTLSEMMEQSDNYSTLAISNYYSIPSIQTTANAIGMSSTSINFTIGCSGPAPESTLTLRDLSRLHEAVANGFLGSQRAKFYELMAEDLSFPSWGNHDLDTRINNEAALLGMSSATRNAFKAALHIAYKPGGIGWPDPGVWTFYFAEGGWMSVPFRGPAGQDQTKEYTFGVFNYLFTGQSNEAPGVNAMSDAELDLVWDRVKPALATWVGYTPGQFASLQGMGCPGSNGTPNHTVSGTPETGKSVTYIVDDVPPLNIAALMIGFQTQTYNGVPLPLDLAPAGMPGCMLRLDPVLLEVAITLGNATKTLAFPNNPTLIGAQFFTQWLVQDETVNAFGWTISNAMRTRLGGWQ